MRRDSGAGGAGARAYALERPAPGRLPWRSARYCAVDLELTGLDPKVDEIVSFGAVPIADGRARPGDAVEGKVRLERVMDEASIKVHGLRSVDLEDAPPLDLAIDPLLSALAGAVPVVHFAEVERRFLGRALRRQGLRLHRQIIDTSVLGAIWLHERDGVRPRRTMLPDLAAALGVPAHQPHDALGDAFTTAEIFIVLATHLDAIRSQSVRSLVTAGRQLQAMAMYPTDEQS